MSARAAGLTVIAASICLVAAAWALAPWAGLLATGAWGVWVARRLAA